jgi:hypothetical protein
VVLRGLERSPSDRFTSALEMVQAFEKASPIVSQREVAAWVADIAGDHLAWRTSRVSEIEAVSSEIEERSSEAPPTPPRDSLARSARLSPEPPSRAELGTMAGMAETLPPPASRSRWRSPRLWTALGVAVGLVAVATVSWQLGRRASSAAAPPNSALAPVALPTLEPSAASPTASASALASAPASLTSSVPTPAPAAAESGGKGNASKVVRGGGATGKPGPAKTTGIYARE